MGAAKTDYVKLEYQLLDLVEYNELKITGNMKILLSLIYSYEKDSRTYYESVTTLGKRVGLEPQATRSLITKLCTAGMISYDERKGSSHIFHSKPLNKELMILIGEEKPKKNRRPSSKKSEYKQEDGKSEMQAEQQDPQAKQVAKQVAKQAATPSADEPAVQNPGPDSGSAAPVVGQQSGVESDPEHGGDDRTDDHHAVNQNDDTHAPFLPKKPASEETAGRVIASLDDLRYWSDVGYEGMGDYGVMWGVSGDDLDNLIREHLKIREAEAEKNFKSQRTH
ncbi:TPA: hypothetical protein PCH82_002111 [Klebsiella pneumoniae]|nr:hypothetical protein [Klebsiella pneumoniae]HDE1103873.1 hypothetical protein [Klebsiella pneumoniae]HDE1232065.1 hypothetical protein [Klebsiella pneumoniae]HDE1612461.1 hypothetical protein [Klebsiella pneumoniae]HDE1631192.1 hypothetical protein [Klebsiella pneumoniae]